MLRLAMALVLTVGGTGCATTCFYPDGRPGACWDSGTMSASAWQQTQQAKRAAAVSAAEQQRRAEEERVEQERRRAEVEALLKHWERQRQIRSACYVVKNDPAATPQDKGFCEEFFANEAREERSRAAQRETDARREREYRELEQLRLQQESVQAQRDQARAEQDQAQAQWEAARAAERAAAEQRRAMPVLVPLRVGR